MLSYVINWGMKRYLGSVATSVEGWLATGLLL